MGTRGYERYINTIIIIIVIIIIILDIIILERLLY